MAESLTTRFSLKRWTADTDTPERADFDGAHLEIATNVAGWLPDDTAANRPAAAAANARFLFRASDTGQLSYSTGSAWIAIPDDADITSAVSAHVAAGDPHTTYLNNSRHDSRDHSTALGTAVIGDLSGVTISSVGANEVLQWSGSAWINRTLAEAGISATGHTHTEANITDLDHLTIEEVQDNLGTSFIVAGDDIDVTYNDGANTLTITSTSPGTTDHGALGGRDDDDHTLYSLVSGGRAFTGAVGGVTPTTDAHLTTKAYVDDEVQSLTFLLMGA